MEKAGYKEQIEFYAEPSHVVLPRLRARGLEIDFAFIDGFHTFDHGMVDFFYIDTLLKENAIVVFDDVSYPSIHKVIRFILTNRSYRVYHYLEYSGRPNELSLRHRAALHVGRLKPAKLLMKPELSIPDSALGFSAFTTCVALRKVAEDTRSFSFHREF